MMDRANGLGVGGGGPGPGSSSGPAAAASRAERFEDEKRRIIESCFSKQDVDGSMLETYITHIRITEFSSHPAVPPPPQGRTPQSEKPRVIIVAVRKSGRVRMHKSKENTNGSFSIGKTWNLEDLSHIESYTGPQVTPSHREWAGDTGFLVTLGKPYYWQAQTDKEKKFFIASLIKIYGKYTGGKEPELSGFDQRELDQVLGGGRRQASGPQPAGPATAPPRPGPVPDAVRSKPSIPPQPPNPGVPDAPRSLQTPPVRSPPNGSRSPAASIDSTASRDRPGRWAAQSNKSQESVAASFVTAKSDDASSLPPRSRNGITGPGTFGRFGEPRDSPEPPPTGPLPSTPPVPSMRSEEKPPERKRPPMDPIRPLDRDLVPPPLSQANRRDPVSPPPPRSTERASPRKDLGQQSREAPPPAAARSQDTPPSAPTPTESVQSTTPKLDPTRGLQSASSTSLPKTGASSPTLPPEPAPEAPPIPPTEEESRPGLGPMIKSKRSKGDIAGTLWKAATAANAFRPRPGGAGERLLQAQNKSTEGPDGITGVVPAPPRPASRDSKGPAPEPPKPKEEVKPPLPEVKITVPNTSRPSSLQNPSQEAAKVEEPSKPKAPSPAPPPKETPRRSAVIGNDAKYLQTLGIDSNVLDQRSEEFGQWLDHFGWVPGNEMRTRNIDDLKVDLDRELNLAQAGGWLSRFEEEDERVDAIKKGIDVAMTECEEMDNLLTLYSVELSTLSDDIAYIEAQGQGLQVQTANQKLLRKEVESLLETCAITSNDLEALRIAPLEHNRGLEDVESTLVTLFRAMIKIDPSLGANDPGQSGDGTMDSEQNAGLNSDYGQMRIVQEKKQMYMEETGYFMQRLLVFMAGQFDLSFAQTKRAMEGALSKKVDASHHETGRDILWKFSPLMLFARDVDLENWNRLIQIYQDKSHPIYKNEFQTVVSVWRKNARKLTGEETELLFSSQVEKQQEGVATAARKLTVKRSQTLARALRSPLAEGGNNRPNLDKTGADSRSLPYEVFAGVIFDLLPLVEMEQNFIIDFFHATTLEHLDFPDAVAAFRPQERRGGSLKRNRLMEPDRELARRVTRSMEVIFSFMEVELQRLMEWVVGQDPLQGIGVLAVLEKTMADMGQSNQDYLNTLLQKLHGNLEGRFRKFMDEQIRAIEETKVKINKRKGVISFVRVFPAFSTAVENMVAGLDPNLALRRTIDKEYDRMIKSMFDSLKVIAREHPAVSVGNASADPEDKEALNFHILLIENMNHFLEEVDTRGLDVLEEWKDQANQEYHEHMGLYLNAVMRRPLGKLLDHLENIEAQMQTGKSPTSIAMQPSNNKSIFNKVLGNYDGKEVRKGIEALRKRVEKHFGDADDPMLGRSLVGKVLRECEGFYGEVEGRIGRVTTEVYSGDVLFEWPRQEVKAAFR